MSTTVADDFVLTRASTARRSGGPIEDADPITTEVLRHGLTSAAQQMRIALRRTAFTPTIYEAIDFACALFDRDVRLLAEAPGVPAFLGTMGFCVEACVRCVGGEDQLEEGDIIFSTYGYDTGSHPQDAVVVAPIFREGELVGYATVKAHLIDVGGKEVYCTDSTDNFQEGTIFPGVKLYRRGERNEEMMRTIVANSRSPYLLQGDLNAEIVAARVGGQELLRLIDRFGMETFEVSVDRMFDHGESVMRAFVERIPDGVHRATGMVDSNGITDEPIPIEVFLEVEGSDIVIDFTKAPPEQPGPVNCPLQYSVSMSRLAILAVIGGDEYVNEGHLRPLAVRTKPGTMFHPKPPAPIFLGGHWAGSQAVDGILRALAEALPGAAPGGCAGDICSIGWFGWKPDGTFWVAGGAHFIGQGAQEGADGPPPMIHIVASGQRNLACESLEANSPAVIRRFELAQDSGGPGRQRGGLGLDIEYELLEESSLISTLERTLTPPWGVFGGGEAQATTRVTCMLPDGSVQQYAKVTGAPMPAGTRFRMRTGGGGGYGPPAERDPAAVREDVRQGYVTEERARRDYPHAFRD